MGKSFLSLILLICLTGLWGCSSGGGSLIVLLPDADGRVGTIEVSNSKGSVLIDKKNEAVSLKNKQEPHGIGIMPEAEIKEIFETALAAQPIPPARFFLNFYWNSDELVSESLPVLQIILGDIRRRAYPHIIVQGHTDRTGIGSVNYKLSEKRAKKVKEMLIQKGILPGAIEISFYGEEMPLIQTGDDAPELLNRRVEVIVR